MKKFFMIMSQQPLFERDGRIVDNLKKCVYEPVGNSRLRFDKGTRFPLIPLVNAYAEEGEKIRIISVTPDYDFCRVHLEQLREEVEGLRQEKGFVLEKGVESVEVAFAGDVGTQIDIFHKLLDYMEDGDTLYGCLTYGMKTMPIAELMAIQYGYRIMDDVSIGCLVYGEVDHGAKNEDGKSPTKIFDITVLVQLDEIVRMLADRKVKNPKKLIDSILQL